MASSSATNTFNITEYYQLMCTYIFMVLFFRSPHRYYFYKLICAKKYNRQFLLQIGLLKKLQMQYCNIAEPMVKSLCTESKTFGLYLDLASTVIYYLPKSPIHRTYYFISFKCTRVNMKLRHNLTFVLGSQAFVREMRIA